jgi:CheY-like chemotaxis protein
MTREQSFSGARARSADGRPSLGGDSGPALALRGLAGGMAHEFNNALAAIMGFAEMSLLKLPPDQAPVRANLENILEASRRGAAQVRLLLTFCRLPGSGRHPLALQALLKEMARQFRAALPPGQVLNTRFSAGEIVVPVNLEGFHSLVLDLWVWASACLGPGGGTLETGLAPVPSPGGRPPSHLRLWVAAHGVDPVAALDGPDLPRIRAAAREQGADFALCPSPDGGVAAEMLLALEGVAESGPGREEAPPVLSGRILVVEDEAILAMALRAMLEVRGHRVATCLNPAKALELLRADPAGWDLVLTDQGLPGMSGSDLCREIRAFRPDLPVLLFTGQDLDESAAGEARAWGVLRKPLRMAELAETVARVLAAPDREAFGSAQGGPR